MLAKSGWCRGIFSDFSPSLSSMEFQRGEAKKKLLKINIYLNLPFAWYFPFFPFKIRIHSINLSYFSSSFLLQTKKIIETAFRFDSKTEEFHFS